jgi:hypothetical protein
MSTVGAFGVVILGNYRGTKVAVKRVLPPVIKGVGSKGSLTMSASADLALAQSGEIQTSKPASANGGTNAKGGPRVKTVTIKATEATDQKSGDPLVSSGNVRAFGSVSGSNTDWERLLCMRHSDNDVFKIIESATASSNGNGTFSRSASSQSHVIRRCVPMWMRWDEHSVRIREFQTEMRLISRLRVSMTICCGLLSPVAWPTDSFSCVIDL